MPAAAGHKHSGACTKTVGPEEATCAHSKSQLQHLLIVVLTHRTSLVVQVGNRTPTPAVFLQTYRVTAP